MVFSRNHVIKCVFFTHLHTRVCTLMAVCSHIFPHSVRVQCAKFVCSSKEGLVARTCSTHQCKTAQYRVLRECKLVPLKRVYLSAILPACCHFHFQTVIFLCNGINLLLLPSSPRFSNFSVLGFCLYNLKIPVLH